MHFGTHVLQFEPGEYICCFVDVLNSSTWARNYKIRPQTHSFNEGLPVMVDTDVIDVIKQTRPFPSILHVASDQILDGRKAWE